MTISRRMTPLLFVEITLLLEEPAQVPKHLLHGKPFVLLSPQVPIGNKEFLLDDLLLQPLPPTVLLMKAVGLHCMAMQHPLLGGINSQEGVTAIGLKQGQDWVMKDLVGRISGAIHPAKE